MSSMSERYVRCPTCNFPNLSGCGVCSECGTQVDEELGTELRRVASDVWYEVWRLSAAVIVGLLVGALVVVVGGIASGGLWPASLAATLTPPTKPGLIYSGPFVLAAVPIVWLILGRLEVHRFGGRIELFDTDEVQAGAWASGLLTVILAAVVLTVFTGQPDAPTRVRPGWFWQAFPLLSQVVAIAGAVITWKWMQSRELQRLYDQAEAGLSLDDASEVPH